MESQRLLLSLKRTVLPYVRRRTFALDVSACVLGALLGRVDILGVALPFGAAFLAGADMAGLNVYYPFLGVALGTLFVGELGFPALFAASLYLIARLVYPLVMKRLLRVDKLLIMGAAQMIMLLLFYLGAVEDFLRGLSGVAFALLLTVSFQNALRALRGLGAKQTLHEEEQIALCLLLGSIALAFSDIAVHAFSLGIVIVAWVAMFTAFSKGLSAVAAAVALGGMLLLGGKAQPLLLADLALCTLAAVICRRMGAWGAAIGFCICCGVTEAYLGVAGQQIGLINALPAAAVLAFIPKKGLLMLQSVVDSSAREERTARAALLRLQQSAAEDIAETAKTVEEVANLFSETADWTHDPERERADMRRAVQHVCGDCAYRGSCHRDSEASMDAVEAMLVPYGQGVRPRAGEPLRHDCQHTMSIAAAAVQARDAYREKCMQAYRAASQQAFVNRQLTGVGKVMRRISTDVRDRAWPDENTSQLIFRRLERDGVRVKGVLVRQSHRALRVELRLHRSAQDAAQVEEALSHAMERPMRLLRAKETARERILDFEQAQKMKAEFGSATLAKRGSVLSGDSTGRVSLPNGQMLYVLSDGMGSGMAAHDQSLAAVQMLLKLYSVGYDRDNALECVNRLLRGKGAEDMYATLDALHLDLRTGKAEFIKYGASPSFVLREGKVHTIYAEALPAGVLDDAMPAVHAATLRRDDAVVLVSDGTLDALGEDTKEEILREVGGANTCEDAAEALLSSARARGAADDMTVMVIRLE